MRPGEKRASGRHAPLALRGVRWLVLLLTLYLCNKSSEVCADGFVDLSGGDFPHDQNDATVQTNTYTEPGILVESVFDFEVPVSVISQGVASVVMRPENDYSWSNVTHTVVDYESLFINGASTNLPLFNPSYVQFNTNHESFTLSEGDYSFTFNTLGSPYSQSFLEDTFTGIDVTNILGKGDELSWLSVPNAGAIQSLTTDIPTDGGSPPADTMLSGAQTIVSGLNPVQSFWLTEVTPEMLLMADGGSLLSMFDSIEDDSPMRWLPGAFTDAASRLADFLNQNKTRFRKFVSFGCCLGYIVLCIRWWFRRIFWLFEVFTGHASIDEDPFAKVKMEE